MPLHAGHTKIPGSATFPNGLPEALGASVALQASPEQTSSDSDNGGMQLLLGDIFFSLAMLILPQAVSANWDCLATVALPERAPLDLGSPPLPLPPFASQQLIHQLIYLPSPQLTLPALHPTS